MPASTSGSARSIWADGDYRSSSSTDRIDAVIRTCLATDPRTALGWLENRAPDCIPNANSRNSTGSSDPGSTTMSARHEPQESSRELGTLERNIIGSTTEIES